MTSCEEVKIAAGSDADFTLPVADENGAPVNLAYYVNVMVIVYTAARELVEKFSVVPDAAWKELVIAGAGDELEFTLVSAKTLAANGQKLFYEVRTQALLAIGVGDGVDDKIETEGYLCTITNSMVSAVPSL